eukprot:4231702-Alexandrium_andersonii.AAC.1
MPFAGFAVHTPLCVDFVAEAVLERWFAPVQPYARPQRYQGAGAQGEWMQDLEAAAIVEFRGVQ